MACQAFCISAQISAGSGNGPASFNVRVQPMRAIRRARAQPGWGPTSRAPKYSVKASAEEPPLSGALLSEDVKYLCKFGICSVAGAAAIKYGSVLFPDATVPDFSVALLLVGSPVIASVFLLAVAGARQDAASN